LDRQPQLTRAAAVMDHAALDGDSLSAGGWPQARVVASQPGDLPQEPLLPFD
jgi:hypothetical protein